MLTERDQESSSPRESALLGVKISVCTRATVMKDKEINGDATCTFKIQYVALSLCTRLF